MLEALTDELEALTNSFGGVLLLGVNDDWEKIDIPEEHMEAMEEMIQKICQQSIRPALVSVIERNDTAGF